MRTTIYLIRHGQSEGNLRECFLGHTDLPLTDLGHQQAEIAAQYLKQFPVDAIYSSDLQRARQTAEHTAALLGIPVKTDCALREIFAGQWENIKFAQLREQFPESYGITWLKQIDQVQCDGGESVLELQKRFVGAVQRIAQQEAGKTVLVFTHGTPLRVFAAYCQNVPAQSVAWATNASVTKVIFENGTFSLQEYSCDDFMGSLSTGFGKDV